MGNLDLDSALSSCRYYPVQVDLRRRVVWFAEVEREVYRRAGFLMPKHAPMSQERYERGMFLRSGMRCQVPLIGEITNRFSF